LPALLPLLGELLTEATYPEPEIAAAVQRYVQQVRVERDKNAHRASERFSRNLFGAPHPYCSEIDLEAVATLTAPVLQAFYRDRYSLSSAEVFVAGDVRDDDVAALLAVLPVGNSLPTPLPVPPMLVPGPARDEIRLPASMQSAVRVGRLWAEPHHPDTHRLFVLNQILGGYFGSRLMKNIREDKGFTYGIYSSVTHREHASSLVIGADVNADSTEATFMEIYHELARLRDELVPMHELDTVRQYATGKFVGDTSTIFDQLSKYQFLVLRGLSADYYDQLLAAIATTTPVQLRELANQYLTPEAMQEVVVGRRD
jgi:predicted Zn-dependent peptidase